MADTMKLQAEADRRQVATFGPHRAPPLGHLLADKIAHNPEVPNFFAGTKSTTQTGKAPASDTDTDVD